VSTLAHDPLDVPPQQLIGAPQPLALPGLAQGQQHVRGLEGLGQVVVGAPLHRFDGQVRTAVGRHQDDGRAGQAPDQLGEELEAVDSGHPEIAEDGVEDAVLGQSQGLLTFGGHRHLVALGAQDQLEAVPQRLVVVDDEDPARHRS
jgi:hypothetical protein